MPDIQTALKSALTKTLQHWDDDDEGTNVPIPSAKQPVSPSSQPIQGIPMTKTFNFGVTNNVSRVTFDYIKNNPGSTRKEIITALEHQGYGGGSVSSLIAQMRRNKMVHETNGLHYADIDEYRPIKTLKAVKKLEAVAEVKPKRKYERKAVGIAALHSDTVDAASLVMPKRTLIVRAQAPDEIIKNLTVFQARELYDRLKQIFNV
jgi:hypothetical protein